MTSLLLISTTISDLDKANDIIKKLLDLKIIACAQTEPINSSFLWMENLEMNQKEVKLTIKTLEQFKDKVVYIIKNNHSYKIPEITALKMDYVEEEYLKWVVDNIGEQEER